MFANRKEYTMTLKNIKQKKTYFKPKYTLKEITTRTLNKTEVKTQGGDGRKS